MARFTIEALDFTGNPIRTLSYRTFDSRNAAMTCAKQLVRENMHVFECRVLDKNALRVASFHVWNC